MRSPQNFRYSNRLPALPLDRIIYRTADNLDAPDRETRIDNLPQH